MTRKDFELIAAILKANQDAFETETIMLGDLARQFADALKDTNKQFNRAKFLQACGVRQ